MSNGTDHALVFINDAHPPADPGTHVLIVGVGKYAYGKGAGASPVAGDLRQLTSPPVSARAIADWFIESFKNQKKPLVSVSLLISEEPGVPYQPPNPARAGPINPPPATLVNVKVAARNWADRLSSNKDNMAVFYFCGHGASLGQQAALLLEDFGDPAAAYDSAIDVNILRGTMKNSTAIQQVFLLDCCRTNVDELYQNEPNIGSRVLSVASFQRGHSTPSQQFVLFPTLEGEEAFGVANRISVFSNSIIDAMDIAAADASAGVWRTTTGTLLNAVDKLVQLRVPEQLTKRSKPSALDAVSFDFNEIEEPLVARSFVTISDLAFWGEAELECVDPTGGTAPQKKHTRDSSPETCCAFTLNEGRWRFTGSLPNPPPNIRSQELTVRVPVAYVKLEVAS